MNMVRVVTGCLLGTAREFSIFEILIAAAWRHDTHPEHEGGWGRPREMSARGVIEHGHL